MVRNSGYPISGTGASEIAASIEAAISTGTLTPGQDLPPIRELAPALGVNANTIAAAYRRLRERGTVETDGRRGTRIRSRPASTGRSQIRTLPPGTRDVSAGNPDPDLLPPFPPLPPARPILYGEPPIDPHLRELAAARLRADEVQAEHLVLTHGALDGIERTFQAHLRPGDPVAMEDPGWAALRDLAAARGLRTRPVPVDDEGIIPDGLLEALRQGARAVLLTLRAHNPTGAAVTAKRADALRAVLAEHPGTLVIEDDHGADLTPTHGAHTLTGTTEHWAHLRSVAKAYGPDLRCAVVSADLTTAERLAGQLRLGPAWISHLIQRTVTALWDDPAVETLVARAARHYDERRTLLRDALAARGIASHGVSGLNLWIPVRDETTTVANLLTAGWAVADGTRFRHRSGPAIRVTTATLDPAEVAPLTGAIADATRTSTGRTAV